ncbi:MAG: NAD(P)/FAD-dependent oxidoreductase [Bacillota bacterium]
MAENDLVALKDGEKGVVLQRDKQTYGIAPHMPCGLCTPEMLRKLADVAEKYGIPAIKITSAERIALLGIKPEDVDAIWAELGMEPGHVVGICVRSVKACPGTTYCKRGQQDSLAVGLIMDRKYHGKRLPGKMKIGVSGCMNQCAETNFKDIGLVGKPTGWMVVAGGSGGGARARIADVIAERLSTEEALTLVDRLMECFIKNAKPHERMGRLIDRIGLAAVKEAVGVAGVA